MKKSLIFGVTMAASIGLTEASWVTTSSAPSSGAGQTISTISSLVKEQSLATSGSLNFSAAATGKATLVGLVTEGKASGTRWKDAAGSGTGASPAWAELTAKIPPPEPIEVPEGSTYAAVVGLMLLVGFRVVRNTTAA